MTESEAQVAKIPPPPHRRWPSLVMMGAIFLSGTVFGAVCGRIITLNHFQSMLRHPEQVPDRILPRIRSTLSLTEEQAQDIEEIVRRRHAAMESIRARGYPDLLAEFHELRTEVSQILTPEQSTRWKLLGDSIEQRYLPTPPTESLHRRN